MYFHIQLNVLTLFPYHFLDDYDKFSAWLQELLEIQKHCSMNQSLLSKPEKRALNEACTKGSNLKEAYKSAKEKLEKAKKQDKTKRTKDLDIAQDKIRKQVKEWSARESLETKACQKYRDMLRVKGNFILACF